MYRVYDHVGHQHLIPQLVLMLNHLQVNLSHLMHSAVPINVINAIVSSPIGRLKGMNNDVIIGIVANDDPIPKVTIKPITYIMIMLNNLLSPVIC